MGQALMWLGGLLAAFGLLVVVWGGRWDPAAGRRRCRRCWYDLTDQGSTPVRCPECGRSWSSERSLTRTRPRRGMMVGGVAMLVLGTGVLVTPAWRSGRWARHMPSWALAELVPFYPPITTGFSERVSPPGYELTMRLMDSAGQSIREGRPARPMSHAETAGVIRRMGEGNWFAPAGSDRWAPTGDWLTGQVFRFYGNFSDPVLRYPDGSEADEALREAFALINSITPRWKPFVLNEFAESEPVRIESNLSKARWNLSRLNLGEHASWRIRGTDIAGDTGFRAFFTLEPVGVSGDEIVMDLVLRAYATPHWERAADEEPLHEEAFVLRWKVVEPDSTVIEQGESEEGG